MHTSTPNFHVAMTIWLVLCGFPARPAEPRREDTSTVHPEDRMRNGGFEQGLAGWKTRGVLLVEDAAAARKGKRCVVGEVRRSKTGAAIRRTFQLRADRVYRLRLWARADSGNRLTIWLHAGGKREVIANWQHVPANWRKYEVHFTVEAGGPVTLRILAPSSFWGPLGRMWLDDLALLELPRLEKSEISGGRGFNDFPALVARDDRHARVAWLSFRDGHDTLQVAPLARSDGGLKPGLARQAAGGPGAKFLHPVLADSGRATWLVFAAETGDDWNIRAMRLDTKGEAAEAIQVTRDPAVDVQPCAVFVDDVLWIAWESNRHDGTRQILLAAVRDGKAGEPVRLSRPGTNNYRPSVAAMPDGSLWVAWHSFRGNNTDLYARVVRDGAPGPERRLTDAAAIDRDVQLAAAGDQIWMAWEHAAPLDYQLGKAATKRVQVARIAPDGLLAPPGIRKTGLWTDAESPAIGLDGHGRVWVAARVVRDRNAGWDTALWLVDREGWTGPFVLSARKGMNRRPAMALLGDSAAVVFQADDMPGRWLSVEASTRGTSGVYLSVADHGVATGPAAPRLEPYRPPGDAYAAASIRVERGEDRRGWSVEHGEATYRLFFGDLHEHSDLSVCDRAHDETPDQSFQMMRDVARFDFGALTDHGKCFNAYLWSHLGKVTRANTDPGRFLTLLGQEWTSTFEIETPEHPYGYYGHRNIFLADPYHPTWYNAALDIKPSALRKQLQKEKADFVIIPHQLADTGNVPVDWNRVDTKDEPVAEIFQMRGSYECKGCPREARLSTPKGYFLQDAWARGIVIGVVASPDHEGGWGKAAVYAPALERKDILEALRARRCYGTTGAKILLDVRVNGLFMGEIGKPPGGKPVRVKIRVDCPAPIETIEVIRNNDVVHTSRPGTKKKELEFVDAEPPDGPVYYYVRVTQRDGEMAWSSPVWLGRIPRTMSRDSNSATKRKP